MSFLSLCNHVPGGAENNSHFPQLNQQRRAAVAEEGQGDACAGHEVCDHRHVQKNLYGKQGAYPRADQQAEAGAAVEGDPIAPQNKQGEKADYEGRADKAQLLADHGEDKIIVLLRKVQEFLAAAPQAQAAEAAGADGIHDWTI